MYRICGLCRLAPRANDTLEILQVPDNPFGVEPGKYQACSACHARFVPGRIDTTSLPHKPRQEESINGSIYGGMPNYYINNLYCPTCRRWARESDEMTILRINEEDIQPDDGVEPGCYKMCSECVDKWKPRVYKRWKRDGVIAEELPFEAFNFPMFV